MILSEFRHLRRLVFNQRYPVHPVLESYGGGAVSVTDEGRKSYCIILEAWALAYCITTTLKAQYTSQRCGKFKLKGESGNH